MAFYPSNHRGERVFFVAESVDGVFISAKQVSDIQFQRVIMIELIADTLESIHIQDLTGDGVPEAVVTFISGKMVGIRAYSIQNGLPVNLMSRGDEYYYLCALWASGGFSIKLPSAGTVPEIWGWERAEDETGAHPPGSIKMASFWYTPRRYIWNGEQFSLVDGETQSRYPAESNEFIENVLRLREKYRSREDR
jgi:hypothetical protein